MNKMIELSQKEIAVINGGVIAHDVKNVLVAMEMGFGNGFIFGAAMTIMGIGALFEESGFSAILKNGVMIGILFGSMKGFIAASKELVSSRYHRVN